MSKKSENNNYLERKKTSRVRYIWAIVFNLIALYVFNNLQNWHFPILTNSWVACLWLLNILLVATIIANIIWFFYSEKWIRALLKIGLNLINLVFIYVLYKIFPFDFTNYGGNTTSLIAKILIIIGLIGVMIGLIVEITHFTYTVTHSSAE
jgi:hypothetical protein